MRYLVCAAVALLNVTVAWSQSQDKEMLLLTGLLPQAW